MFLFRVLSGWIGGAVDTPTYTSPSTTPKPRGALLIHVRGQSSEQLTPQRRFAVQVCGGICRGYGYSDEKKQRDHVRGSFDETATGAALCPKWAVNLPRGSSGTNGFNLESV